MKVSLQVKIVSLILVILLFSVSFSISFALNNQKDNLLDAAQQTLAVNTGVLKATITNIMLNGEAPLANRTMADLRNLSSFLEYEIYRTDGSLAFSDFDTLNFVNSFQQEITFPQTPRLEGNMIDNPDFQIVLNSPAPLVRLHEETQEMEYFFPLINVENCRACHGTENFVRGVSHFRISLSDVYGKVASARRLLSLFFLGVGLFIFLGILILLRRIVISPLLSIGRVVNLVGEGDLDVQVEVRQNDELGDLASRINRMILGLKNSKELEREKTRIEARLEESRKYLDNISEGLLLLDREYRITEEYSAFLQKLFEKDQVSGLTLGEFVYGNTLTEEQQEELNSFLQILFTNRTAAFSMILDLNPLDHLEIFLPSGKKIVVAAQFQRIYQGEEVENVMVLFQDLTDIVETREALESERKMRESELEQIAAILKLGPQVFEDFIQSARDVLAFIETNLAKLNRSNILNQVFRDTHSLKGSARYLKFSRMEDIAHRLEDHFDQFREEGASLERVVTPEFEALIEELQESLNSIENIISRFRQFSVGKESNFPEMELFRSRLMEMVEDLSTELGKKVRLNYSSDWDSLPGLKKLQIPVFHLIRNALDHGIEDPLERVSLGKEEEAIIGLSFARQGKNLNLVVSDDGRGLDFEQLEKKALETGLLKPGRHFPSQILKTLFMPGFSSRKEVSSLSGRGVGLDAVKEDIQALKGKINVKTTKGKGMSFIITLPLDSLEDKG